MGDDETSAPGRLRRAGLWAVVTTLGVLFAVVVGVAGVVNASIGNDAIAPPSGTSDTVPRSVTAGGTVVDGRASPPVSTALPPRTIALTFDDGPDPTWTPQVLGVLARHRVPGTFFVVGSMATRHPDLLRAIRAQGSELGVHTFTHVDLAEVGSQRFGLELGETQLAIVGATGETTYLMRPPFSSTPDAVDDESYGTLVAAGRDGYVTVLTDVDSEDWQRPGVDAIVRNATPRAGAGGTVLFHDAGGDRSQTVAALDRYITTMQAQGYRFTTVPGAVGMPAASSPATAHDRWVGEALVTSVGLAVGAVRVMQVGLIVVGLVVVVRLLLTLVVARRHARRRRAPGFRWGEPVDEPVSVIVPAFNEKENIEATLRSILANDHPLEVLVVDDGSTDGTAALVERLALPSVRVIRQPNSGKAVALNTGVARARHDLVIMMDGDTVFEPTTIAELVAPFADPEVGAVAGNVKVANRESLIPRLQHIEYVVGFTIDRRVQDTLGTISTIPGAAGAFRRRAVVAVGGISQDTLAEDTDLTIALGRAGWRVVYNERARAWTEAPITLAQLWRQRYRWTYGTMQAVWKHRRAVRESGPSGRMGRVGLLHIGTFQVLFPLAAPLVDVFFVYGMLFGDQATTLLLWGSMLAIQTLGAAYAFRLDGEPYGPLWAAPVQQLMYRQLMYAVLVRSVISALSGVRVRWQQMHRLGALRHLVPDALVLSPAAAPPATPALVPATRAERVDAARAVGGRPGTAGAAGGPGPMTGTLAVGSDGRSTPHGPAQEPAPDPGPPDRLRWLDSLRALALVRVVVYHVVGAGWLSLVFPSMGVMFALAGSLMLQSLRRGETVDVVGRRIKRLLPPFWLFGAIVVTAMFVHGWPTGSDTEDGLSWSQLLFWVLPLFDPPGTEWAGEATVVLWYIRAYLWFVLLTPLLLWAWRRRPALALTVPLLVVAANTLLGDPLSTFGALGPVLGDFFVFASCWVLGFAHRDGTLARMATPTWLAAALVPIGLGVAWTVTHPSPEFGLDLNEIPLGQALVSLGAVLLILRFSPRMTWMERVPGLGRLVAIVNARAVSIYLWHNVAIALAPAVDDVLGWESTAALLATSVVLTVLATLALGWAEDLAAGRTPAIVPGPHQTSRRSRRRHARPVPGPPRIEVPPETEESSLAALTALRGELERAGRVPVGAGVAGLVGAAPAVRPMPAPVRAAHPLAAHPSFPPVPVPTAVGRAGRAGWAGRPAGPPTPPRAAPVPSAPRPPAARRSAPVPAVPGRAEPTRRAATPRAPARTPAAPPARPSAWTFGATGSGSGSDSADGAVPARSRGRHAAAED